MISSASSTRSGGVSTFTTLLGPSVCPACWHCSGCWPRPSGWSACGCSGWSGSWGSRCSGSRCSSPSCKGLGRCRWRLSMALHSSPVPGVGVLPLRWTSSLHSVCQSSLASFAFLPHWSLSPVVPRSVLGPRCPRAPRRPTPPARRSPGRSWPTCPGGRRRGRAGRGVPVAVLATPLLAGPHARGPAFLRLVPLLIAASLILPLFQVGPVANLLHGPLVQVADSPSISRRIARRSNVHRLARLFSLLSKPRRHLWSRLSTCSLPPPFL